ncbi:MAG: DNA-directed RNA polymerase subunit alpha [Dehalococcoidia bacterium]|nr:DNA-directed RNA polymerase subunit alpha [Dehalococcoidia bacterium]
MSAIPKIQLVESRENFGRFMAEPLEKGFGVTLGNSLRRVMLGYLPGAAVARVKIDGVHHEFSSIPHAKEDVIEFLLNVKAIRIKTLTDRPGKLILDIAGEGIVTAADIKPSADFEIVNPELYLATMDSADARLYAELDVELGIGFKQAESTDNLPVGVIPIDAIFTPTRKVNFIIEPVHVGRETSLERLYLEIWTDGTLEPSDALSKSATILMDLLTPFASYGKMTEIRAEKEAVGLAIPQELFNMPVEQLNLSVRTMNCLRRGNIATVGEVISKGEKGLMTLRNFGIKSLQELEERLSELGFTLRSPDRQGEDLEATPVAGESETPGPGSEVV